MEDSLTAFVVIDYDYVFLSVNRTAEKFYGKNKDELLGRKAKDIFPDLWDFGPFKNSRKAVDAKQPFQIEYNSPFSKKWVQLSGKPYEDFYTYTYKTIDYKSMLNDQLRKEVRKTR